MRIIAVPTWNCNFNCPYCAYKKKCDFIEAYTGLRKFSLNELPAKIWIDFFSVFDNCLIDFTGGEPLLYPKLAKIIDSLPAKCKWAITSNTSELNKVFSLDPADCQTWTASFHPYAPFPFSKLDFFLSLLQTMKNYGYINIACTIVYLPWQHTSKFIKSTSKRFKRAKIKLNWHPYHFHNYKWKKEELKIAKKLSPKFKPNWEPFGIRKICDAGKKYFVVNNDGTIYPCYSHLIFNTQKLGSIQNKWDLLNNEIDCLNPCIFPCDYLTNNIRYVRETSHE
jgi:sulfatase maturation enzyme AslB (radical SAM superfamily)